MKSPAAGNNSDNLRGTDVFEAAAQLKATKDAPGAPTATDLDAAAEEQRAKEATSSNLPYTTSGQEVEFSAALAAAALNDPEVAADLLEGDSEFSDLCDGEDVIDSKYVALLERIEALEARIDKYNAGAPHKI